MIQESLALVDLSSVLIIIKSCHASLLRFFIHISNKTGKTIKKKQKQKLINGI
jgi:hypothetical protein